jgi:membrane-associated phospholipid phosphatase
MQRAIWALGGLWALDLAWAAWAGLSVIQLGALGATLAILVANALLYRRVRGGERATELAWSIAMFTLLGTGFTLLSYLGLTLHMPLADPWLARFDAALGFDWTVWQHFVLSHAVLHRLLAFGYGTLPWQLAFTVFALPLSGMFERNREFLLSCAITLGITIVVSALFPAESAWVFHNSKVEVAPGPLHDFQAMRADQLTTLNLDLLRGLVTFPSFHTSAAVLLAWAARGTRFWFLSLVVNALMIASTPSQGGHYLADVIAGALVAGLAIWLGREVSGLRPETRQGALPLGSSPRA